MIHIKRLLIATVILYSSVFFVDYLISQWTIFHYGKDDGLVFRVITVSFSSSIFFLIVKKKFSLHIGIGFIIGILSYFLVFAIYITVSVINGGNRNRLVLSMLGDQLAATTIVFIVGLLYLRFIYRKNNERI
jgi:hypothetical protein